MRALGITPSLACYYYSLKILQHVMGSDGRGMKKGAMNLSDYTTGVLSELAEGGVDLCAGHPDDLLFFTELMSMLVRYESDDTPSLRAELVDFVVDNGHEKLTDSKFFHEYFLNFIIPHPERFSMDTVYAEYRRLFALMKPDKRIFRFMLDNMLKKKNITYLPRVFDDLLASGVSLYSSLVLQLFDVTEQNMWKLDLDGCVQFNINVLVF